METLKRAEKDEDASTNSAGSLPGVEGRGERGGEKKKKREKEEKKKVCVSVNAEKHEVLELDYHLESVTNPKLQQ